LVFKSIS